MSITDWQMDVCHLQWFLSIFSAMLGFVLSGKNAQTRDEEKLFDIF